MQGMIDLVRRGEIPPGSRVLYAHLGGVPALNGYSYLFLGTGRSSRSSTASSPGRRAASRPGDPSFVEAAGRYVGCRVKPWQ